MHSSGRVAAREKCALFVCLPWLLRHSFFPTSLEASRAKPYSNCTSFAHEQQAKPEAQDICNKIAQLRKSQKKAARTTQHTLKLRSASNAQCLGVIVGTIAQSINFCNSSLCQWKIWASFLEQKILLNWHFYSPGTKVWGLDTILDEKFGSVSRPPSVDQISPWPYLIDGFEDINYESTMLDKRTSSCQSIWQLCASMITRKSDISPSPWWASL